MFNNYNYVALLLDVIFVNFFAFIGRTSHHKSVANFDVFKTAWPFLVGLGVGWALAYLFNLVNKFNYHSVSFNGYSLFPNCFIIWLITMIVGMVIWNYFISNVQFSFVLVASTFMAIFLFGWRVLFTIFR